MNLLILLLVSRTYVPKERIRDTLEAYRDSSQEAFERMFERDKDELRALGIPIETGSQDAYFDDEPGYRVARDAFELPAVELEPDEAAVVGLAARVWQHAGMADATSKALLKLAAAGVATDREAIDVVSPRLVADEPAFDDVWSACQTRTPIRFDYRRGDQPEPSTRHLQPWGVVSSRGRWYVVGHDADRGEPRLFRLSRVVGRVAAEGEAGSFTVPAGTDVRELARLLAPERPSATAVVRARSGEAHALRRRASTVTALEGGWDRLELEYADLGRLAGDVLACLDAVVVEQPDDLRAEVVRRLRGLAHPDGVSLEAAARQFGVTTKQIVRDLNVVWFCGLPGLGPGDLIDVDMDALGEDGDGVVRLSNAEFLTRPLRLQSSEASALVLALRALREGTPGESREAIDRALVKLEAATSEGASAEVIDVPAHDPRTAGVRRDLEDALDRERQVRLGYVVESRDETTDRVVDPLAVLDAEGSAYLDAWCHLAEGRRLFRLDRVEGLEVLDTPVEQHDVEPRDLSEGLFEASHDDVLATVRLARPARWVAEYYPVVSRTELEDGGLEVDLRAGDPRWLVRLVLRLAPYAEVVGPVAVSEAVTAQARAALAAYDA
ncbi:hypothetical protein LUZ63_020573 [Rhynchospora breviuscula]|uniref:WYL domain-containing protein n=1 Tax=Rhynchospora breviuscula TaxID=2022672 RepID=A0A9P9Z8F7_9POAL|nr:hypothetical protein LUZ63_020573 [Rhynchospora breviuscula]